MASYKDTLLEFPCDFPIKIMGKAEDTFAEVVLSIVSKHAPDFDATRMELRASSGGNYLSVTCTIVAQSKPQLDAIYMDLTAHPMVKVAL
jgi:putative lipoic acid-binding regulatory protein